MQIVLQTDNELVLTDQKEAMKGRVYRGILLVALIVGLVFGWKYVESTIQTVALILSGLLGLSFAIAILVKESYSSTTTIDRTTRRISVKQANLFSKKEYGSDFDELAELSLVDAGGEITSWEIEFSLRDGTSIGLSAIESYVKKAEAEAMVDLIQGYLV